MKLEIEMKQSIRQFVDYLRVEKGSSERTVKAYEFDLSKFMVFVGQDDPDAIRRGQISDFLANLASHNNNISARVRKLSAIRSYFKFLKKKGLVNDNPALDFDTPKIPERESSYLTQEEYERLLDAIKQNATPFYKVRDLAIISLFLSAGLRVSELVNLRIDDINFKGPSITVIRKGNKEQTIPITDNIAKQLRAYISLRPKTSICNVFISRKGNNMKVNTVHYMAKKYFKLAKLNKPKLSVHSLRHTFCTNLLRSNVNLFTIQQLAGHKSIETTKKYLHTNLSELREAVNLINI